MAASGKPSDAAKRMVSFFRLVVEDQNGNPVRFRHQPWPRFLETIKKWPLEQRTFQGPTRRLIGEVLEVDSDLALKLMEPRDENSWLEILRADAAAEPVDPERVGQLVETTIVAFLGEKNLFGLIRGSTSSPSHVAVAEWIDHLAIDGRRLVPDPKAVIRAEPALSRRQRQRLNASDGVSMASVRISTSKAQQLEEAGSAILAETLKSLSSTYGDIVVTVTMRVPRGRAYDQARRQLKEEAQRLRTIVNDAEAVTATLVHYDAEAKAHQEDIDFVSQRIAVQKGVPLTGDDGQPIRNSSAVRAILSAAYDLRTELSSVA